MNIIKTSLIICVLIIEIEVGRKIMKDKQIKSKSDNKIPSYVPIYNMLYSDIINGLYKYGEELPGEISLTQKYGVSRNTLRQALTILNEDGLIDKHQGKSTIVTYRENNEKSSIKEIVNPIVQCAKEEIDEFNITYNYGPPTDIAQKKLNIKANEIIMASNNVYLANKVPIGHAFIQIPVRFINDINIDLNLTEEIYKLVNSTIFKRAASAKVNIRLIRAEKNITSFLQIANDEPVIYMEEILFDELDRGIARCKFYFIPEKYDICLSL